MRALASLGMSMLVLGRYYYVYIPALADLDLLGALILGVVLVIIFLGIGWLYDERGRMWSQKVQVGVQRDPYRFVPNNRSFAIDFPVTYAVLSTLQGIFQEHGMDTKEVRDLVRYLRDYYDRKPEREDIERAEPVAEEFIDDYPFSNQVEERDEISLTARLKYGFELGALRLSWVHELTGIYQDVLVFGAFYVTILFPGVAQNNMVPVEYLMLGLLLISFPLLVGITLIGWFYDRKLQAWSANVVVNAERNPFYYVPPPRYHVLELPFFYALLRTLSEILHAENIENREVELTLDYLLEYGKLRVSEDEDISTARELQDSRKDLFGVYPSEG